ncbi:hypothetical protein K466DRAFT_507469, partial [Polyporus arcularius HHB13444]
LGVAKREYPLITHSPEFDPGTQAKLVCAISGIFNFVRRCSHSGTRSRIASHTCRRVLRTVEGEEVEIDDDDEPLPPEVGELHQGYISQAEKDRADIRRDQIAMAMWEDYVEYIAYAV